MTELKCPQCGAAATLCGETYRYQGKAYRQAVCTKCPYRWGAPEVSAAEVVPAPVHAPAPPAPAAAPVPPVPAVAGRGARPRR